MAFFLVFVGKGYEPGGEDMRKWTWQWFALIGLSGMMFGAFAFVQVDLLPLIPLLDEDTIEVYHEPLYYEHYLVKEMEARRRHRT